MALPVPPIVMLPTPHETADKLVKDDKLLASELIRRHTGWRGGEARIARAVMGAESAYNPNADNGICCVGLMQVNADAHKGSYGIPADRDKAVQWLKDPVNNVEAAYRIWTEQGWDAWEAYTNGSYRKFLGQNPLITIKARSATTVVADAADAALGPVDEIAGALLNPSTWLRVGKGALGGTLLVLGTGAIVFVVANKAAKSNVARTVAKAAPGPAGKIVRKVT